MELSQPRFGIGNKTASLFYRCSSDVGHPSSTGRHQGRVLGGVGTGHCSVKPWARWVYKHSKPQLKENPHPIPLKVQALKVSYLYNSWRLWKKKWLTLVTDSL